MTEVHHGSNVAALETEAVYEAERDEWIVNTPNDGAIKWYCVSSKHIIPLHL